MEGANIPRSFGKLVLLGSLVLGGCAEGVPPEEASTQPAREAGKQWDPESAGEVRGRLVWQGELPRVPPYRAPASPFSEQATGSWHSWPNPHAPRIDRASRGVAGAVIELRGIEPQRCRPWDHAPVRVELHDFQLHVCQGEGEGMVGLVRQGDTVEIASRQAGYQSLQGRGAAFFSRPLPDPDRPCTVRLRDPGVVELQSGVGHFWIRGYLFVANHPYLTLTDRQGRFVLPQVPPGRYQLACWLPSWQEVDYEIDADTTLVTRLAYQPAYERAQSLEVPARQVREVQLEVDTAAVLGNRPYRAISRSPQFPRLD